MPQCSRERRKWDPTEKPQRSIGSFLFQLCRFSQRMGCSVNEETFYFALNVDRQCRSPGISAALFSHLADNGPIVHGVESRGKRVSDSPKRVCPPEITASTCRTQRELFQSESGVAAESIIGEVRGALR